MNKTTNDKSKELNLIDGAVDRTFVRDGGRESDLNKSLEQRVSELESLLLPFKQFDSNQLYEMYDEYCRRQLTGQTISSGGGNYAAGQVSRTTGQGTGTQAITGLGFKPKMIRAVSYIDGYSKSCCWGVAVDGVGEFYSNFTYLSAGGAWDWNSGTTFFVNLYSNSGTSDAVASIASYDPDGFTISWDNVTSDFYIQWEAFG